MMMEKVKNKSTHTHTFAIFFQLISPTSLDEFLSQQLLQPGHKRKNRDAPMVSRRLKAQKLFHHAKFMGLGMHLSFSPLSSSF
jgi:hypothetical protein